MVAKTESLPFLEELQLALSVETAPVPPAPTVIE
jgi:hypothetical protein